MLVHVHTYEPKPLDCLFYTQRGSEYLHGAWNASAMNEAVTPNDVAAGRNKKASVDQEDDPRQ